MSFYSYFIIAQESSSGGLFDFNGTLPLMALQFLLLTSILNFIFYRPLSRVIDEREEYIQTTLSEASALLDRADSLTNQYEEELAKARRQAQEKINAYQREAQQEVSGHIQNAQKEAEKRVAQATQEINIQKENALKSLEGEVETLSQQIISKVLAFNLPNS